jgi:citrate synthase
MSDVRTKTPEITRIVLEAKAKAQAQTAHIPPMEVSQPLVWPVQCTVGPGLEGAIACESKVGYVNGEKGELNYRGYDIFDLCAHSTFEEVSFLLLHGHLPSKAEFAVFNEKLIKYRDIDDTLRLMLSFPVEKMNTMSALRLGSGLLGHEFSPGPQEGASEDSLVIGTDEDSISNATKPMGEQRAIYEMRPDQAEVKDDFDSCYRLIAGLATITAAVARTREGKMPLDAMPELSHAGNFFYMMTGKLPTPQEERIMDIALILHADHGTNASTFASLVVASTLSDIYFSIGAGISALNGPLHGGANEQVLHMLNEIGSPKNVDAWFEKAAAAKKRVMGFGHRVYKACDPRARVLGPLAEHMSRSNPESSRLLSIAQKLEEKVVAKLGESKKIFPNVDLYSGILYGSMGIPSPMYTPIFAVSRVSGWTARVMEYLEHNRIFRPRARYVGPRDLQYVDIEKR